MLQDIFCILGKDTRTVIWFVPPDKFPLCVCVCVRVRADITKINLVSLQAFCSVILFLINGVYVEILPQTLMCEIPNFLVMRYFTCDKLHIHCHVFFLIAFLCS